LKQLIWSGPARHDLYQIASDYRQIDPALPDSLLERIEEAPLRLLDFPALGSLVGRKGIRKWPVRKTPFVLFYTIRRDVVEIRRVVAVASDWSDWLR
jgi:plasmid stabilization system protein ParE